MPRLLDLYDELNISKTKKKTNIKYHLDKTYIYTCHNYETVELEEIVHNISHLKKGLNNEMKEKTMFMFNSTLELQVQ